MISSVVKVYKDVLIKYFKGLRKNLYKRDYREENLVRIY